MSICAKIVLSQNYRDVKNEVFEKKIAFFLFDAAEREAGKNKQIEKRKKGPKTL